METKKATGRQGWWFAVVDGAALPCVHKHWLTGLSYHDPFKRHEHKNIGAKIGEYVDAVAAGRRVILTDDDATLDSDGEVIAFARSRYIAVFEVDDVTYAAPDGLRFRLVDRLCHLEP